MSYQSEDDLISSKEKQDNYIISRVLKYLVLVVISAVVLCVTFVFLWNFFTNETFQDKVLGVVIEQLGVIVVAGMGILGYKKLN